MMWFNLSSLEWDFFKHTEEFQTSQVIHTQTATKSKLKILSGNYEDEKNQNEYCKDRYQKTTKTS